MPKAKAKFKAGDIVVLKSGGPQMTIEIVDEGTEYSSTFRVEYWCVWFSGKKNMKARYNEEVLIRPDVPDADGS